MLDLRLLSQHIASHHDKVFLDSSNSYLYVNFFDGSIPDRYQSSAIIFPDGAMVTWYMGLDSEIQIASEIIASQRSVIGQPGERESLAMDQFQALEHIETVPVTHGTNRTMVDGDSITLTSIDANRSNEMLAVSLALGAAARMNVIESRLQSYIERGQSDVNARINKLNQWRLSHLSECVFEAEKGVHRWRYLLSSIHHRGVPDTLWEYDDLDRLYDSVTTQFELNERYEDLQNQLSYYSDFLKTVGDYVRHGYSSRLEKIIILIIAIEAAIALRHLYVEMALPPLASYSSR